MNRILNAILIVVTIAFILGILNFLFLFKSIDLDEDKILSESRNAFFLQKYNKFICEKSSQFDHFCKFLINNADSLICFNQSNLSHTFEIKNGQKYGFIKTGDCFTFITTNDSFLLFYVPPMKIDSIKYFIKSIGEPSFVSFDLCTSKDHFSINKKFGNVVFRLDAEDGNLNNPNFYTHHYLSFNKIESLPVLEIKEIASSLKKDTTLTDKLKYIIRIDPYAVI